MKLDRETLIGLCRDGVVPQDKWTDRDTARAQMQLGQALALLAAGCEYSVRAAGDKTVSVRIEYRGFDWFEGGYDYEDRNMYLSHDEFYIPTRARLTAVNGGDWYC